MVQIVWVFVFFGAIASGTCNIFNHPLNLKRSFGIKNESSSEHSKAERSLCTTKECQNLAKLLTEGMNKSVNPCDNFYDYVCGNWKMHNPLPPNEKRWSLIAKLQRNVDRRLEEILTSEAKPEDFYALRFSKRAYAACINTDEMEKAGLQPLVSTLWRAGGWPLIMEEEEWDEKIYKWQTIDDYYASIIGVNTFHDLHVGRYTWENDDKKLFINTPHLPENMDNLINLEEMLRDSSDENNESGEGSQEKGSEEQDKNDEGDDNDDGEDEGEDDDDEEDYEDEFSVQKRKIDKRKVNKKLADKTRRNKKIKTRTKRNIIKTKSKHQKVVVHKMNKFLEHKPVSQPDSIKEFVTNYNPTNNKKHENTNNDLYFNDDVEYIDDDVSVDTNGNEDENGDINLHEDVKESSGDTDDNKGDGESGSGSGDYDYEIYDDDDGSGSGDHDDDETDEDNSSEERLKERLEAKKQVIEFRRKYAEYMLNVSMALAKARGVLVPEEKLKKDIADLLEFEIKLIKIRYRYGNHLDTTIQLFQKKYNCLEPATENGKINWIRKIKNLFISGGMEIDKTTEIMVPAFGYIISLQKLLDQTPSKTIVNYVHWNFLSRVIKTTTKEMRDWYYSWGDKPIMTIKERSDLCVDEIGARFSLGYEYIKKYFSDEIVQTASDMIDDIQKEVEYQIKESTWMNAKTKHIILDKLVYLEKMIGYPESYRNSTIMNEYLKGLSASRSHYENTLAIMRYKKREKLKIIFLKTTTDSEEFPVDPLIVNAFFVPFYNAIEITAADFQSPFFDFHQPWYTNFGAVGAIMAHEVNHGFDNSGRRFDKYGEYMEWLPAMAEAYEKRAECFHDQFTKYSVVDKKTGKIQMESYGIQTGNENIADTMGLLAAYKAYQRRQRVCNESDPILPGLENFSIDQLFFISYGNLWCEVTDPAVLAMLVLRDSHSLGPLRLIGSVSNSEDFAKAFKCPEGSPMNPKKKCNIWK